MIVNNAKDMKDHVHSVLKHGFKLNGIEMEENLSIFIIVTDLSTGDTHDAHIGFPENESLARQNVKRSMDLGSGGIIIGQN